MSRVWADEAELAKMMLARARQGKRVILRPETAAVAANALLCQASFPTRDDVALLVCRLQCKTACASCIMTANAICNQYGARLSKRYPK